MRLKQVRVAGFKSFVDPTTFSFASQRVAVVGPNGSGKSNVIDAIRFVLGESSAKSLRGDSISDVIFNGSLARKPVGQAMVELVFEDCAHRLRDSSFGGYEELSIRRQVNRNGESRFYINGTQTRRKDVTDLLLGTGLGGGRSYAVIEQGMIGRFIEAKPDDLRTIFEEAAGISLYKERRSETENRVAHARENLERLEAIVAECAEQYQHLEAQAAVALRYAELQQQEQTLKLQLLLLQKKYHTAQMAKHQGPIERLEQECTEQEAQGQALQAAIQAAIQEEEALILQKEQKQQEVYQAQALFERLEQERNHQEGQKKHWQRVLEQIEKEQSILHQRLEMDQDQLAKNQQESLALRDQSLGYEAEYQAVLARQQAMAEELEKARQAQEKAAEQRLEPWRRMEQMKAKTQAMEQSLIRAKEQLARLAREREQAPNLAEAQAAIAQHQQEKEEGQQKKEQYKSRLEQIQQDYQILDRDCQTVDQRVEQALKEFRDLEKEAASIAAVIQAMERARSSEKHRAWLKKQGLDTSQELFSVLPDCAGWEPAVEMILDAFLHGLIDPALRLGSAHQPWTVSDLEQSFTVVSRELFAERGAGWESSSISRPQTMRDILSEMAEDFAAFLGLDHIYCAQHEEEVSDLLARLPLGSSVMLSDGRWFGRGWVRYRAVRAGGALGSWGTLEHSKRQMIVGEKLASMRASLEALRLEKDSFYQKKNALADERKQTEKSMHELEKRLLVLDGQIQEKTARWQYQSQRMSALEADYARIQEEMEKQSAVWREEKALVEELHTEYRRYEAEEQGYKKAYAECQQKISALRTEVDQRRSALEQLQKRYNAIEMAIAGSGVSQEHWQEQSRALQERRLQAEEQLTQQSQLLEEQQQRATEKKAVYEALHAEAELLSAGLAAYRRDKQKKQEDWQECCLRKERLTQTIAEHRSQRDSSMARIEMVQKQLEEFCQSMAGVLEEILQEQEAQLPEKASIHQWNQLCEAIRAEIQSLGAVNQSAPAEWAQCAERQKHLEQQRDDVLAGLSLLEQAMAEIDQETSARLRETLNTVNQRFSVLFPQLFGGGEAFLSVHGEDILQAGIVLHARPPGKSNNRLTQLSGGEKALTAVALIFSLFSLNPAPFCLLDEVDAPLDEANVRRFTELLKSMSDTVQCIFITHNKVTMEIADTLIGVTMREAGVSRLVEVNMQEALAL